MKVFLLDISGKVKNYDIALFEALNHEVSNVSVSFLAPGKGLISLIPKRYQYSGNLFKRMIKVFEGLMNYAYTGIKISFTRPDVLHLQWLPFMEIVDWEIKILKCFKLLSPKTRLVLTIHNIYPHNISNERKKAYNARFRMACSLFDAFIVHTNISRDDVIRHFGLSFARIYVCCHGVFEPQGIAVDSQYRKGRKLHILQFGGQSFYKGTDLLVDAVCGLDEKRKKLIETRIVGSISKRFLNELKTKDKDSIIKWRTLFLSDEELYREINAADLIVLPYRAISQSGVLLLSIYFEKLIICSDLPSFKETMLNNDSDELAVNLFFKSEDSTSLRNLIVQYIDDRIDECVIRERIRHLKQLFSWNNAAKSTLEVYKSIC